MGVPGTVPVLVQVPKNGAPAVVDWAVDGQLRLVLGSRYGIASVYDIVKDNAAFKAGLSLGTV